MTAQSVPLAIWGGLDLGQLERCDRAGIRRIYPSINYGVTRHPAYPDPVEGPRAMDRALERAHSLGIEIHPYMAVFLMPLGVLPDHPLARHAGDFSEKVRSGDPATFGGSDFGSGTMLSYGYPEVRALIVETFVTMTREFPVDGIMLDYIRYPDVAIHRDANGVSLLGYANPVVAEFREKTGRDPFRIPNDDPEWMGHRAEQVTRVIRELRAALPPRNGKLMEISVCTGGEIALDVRWHFRDWRTWVREGLVETLCPMLYEKPDLVGRYTRAIRQSLSDATGFTLLAGICTRFGVLPTPTLFRAGYAAAMENGADGICIYRTEGLDENDLWGEVPRLYDVAPEFPRPGADPYDMVG